jgi:hypothetical protein
MLASAGYHEGMITLLLIIIVVLLLMGGGWGYRHYR